MIQRMLASALFAGCAAGLLAALLHFAFVQNVLLLAEEYESGTLVHFPGAEPADAGHDHGAAAEPAASEPAADTDATAEEGHSHAAGTPEHQHSAPGGEESQVKRNALTVVFMVLVYVAYAMMLVAAYALAANFGITVSPRDGLLWGIAGFLAFQLAPAMGLAPELPGTVAADLGERQVWWWSTVFATMAGLGLLAWGRTFVTALVAGALLAAPHVIGAPEIDGYFGVAPPEVAATFAARVLGTALVVWAALGWMTARLWATDRQA